MNKYLISCHCHTIVYCSRKGSCTCSQLEAMKAVATCCYYASSRMCGMYMYNELAPNTPMHHAHISVYTNTQCRQQHVRPHTSHTSNVSGNIRDTKELSSYFAILKMTIYSCVTTSTYVSIQLPKNTRMKL